MKDNNNNKSKHSHKDCKCLSCQHGKEAVTKMQNDSIKEYGWYAHYVFDDPLCPGNTNIHTHHVMESFGHKDFQICLNMDPRIAHSLIINAVEEVKKGVVFEPGKKYDKIIKGYKVEFIKAIECGRHVLRLLIPDPNGTYEGLYAEQLTKLNNEEKHKLN